MKKRNSESPTDRRNFLKGAVAAGGVAAISVISASKLHDDKGEPPEREQDIQESRGYHETDHIRAYYRTLNT